MERRSVQAAVVRGRRSARLLGCMLACVLAFQGSLSCSRGPRMEIESRGDGTPCQIIPLEYLDGRILVKARFNQGPEDVPLLLDTGSNRTVVSPEVAEACGCEPEGFSWRLHFVKDAAGTVRKISRCTMQRVSMGGVTFRDVRMILLPTDPQKRSGRGAISGIIGSDLLREAVLTIDYRRRILVVCQGGGPRPEMAGAHRMAFRFHADDDPGPLVKCVVKDGLKRRILLDTGYDGWIHIPDADYRKTGPPPGELRTVHFHGACASTLLSVRHEARFAGLERLALGSLEIEDLPVEVGTAGWWILGNRFLERFRVQLDYPRRELLLQPCDSLAFVRGIHTFGFGWTLGGGRVVVNCLWGGFPAMEGGMQIGDEIVSVDGLAAAPGASRAETGRIEEALGAADRVELVLSRDGRRVEMTLERRGPIPPAREARPGDGS